MKAALIIDMPENCEACLLERALNCKATASVAELGMTNKQKLLRCPLKAIPEKGDIKKAKTMTTLTWIEGFNACIDAICGKE